MSKKYILSILSILAIFLSWSFITLVSADTSVKNLTNIINKGITDEAPQVSTTIIISQVYGGGGSNTGTPTYKSDYIELFNISGTSQSLNGLALQYGSATGQFGSTSSNIIALPAATLQPGQYFLVQVGPVGTAGADFPVTPDFVTTNLTVSATSGKVALTNTATALGCGATATPCTFPDARIIDLIAYGASNNAEGGVSVNNGAALNNTQGSVRNGGGCADTDNNNNDFTVVTNPVPRNAASALAPCGSGTPTPTITPTPTATPTSTPTPSATPTPTPNPSPSATPTPVPGVTVIINEADADTAGADMLEFIELYDGGVGNTSLNGLVVVFYNGFNDMSYASFDLDGFTTNASGYFTLGNAAVPGVDLIFADNLLQNGQDAIALYAGEAADFPNGTLVTTTNLRDALVYDTTDDDDAGLLVLLNAGQPQIDENATMSSATVSMQRCTNGSGGARNTSTYLVQSPTADGVNTCADPTSTPSPTATPTPTTTPTPSPTPTTSPTPLPTPTPPRRARFDFNGDSRSNLSVFRPSNGVWYVQNSQQAGFSALQFGIATDRLAPADFDGDFRTDIAVFRPSNGFWYLQRSALGATSMQFGSAEDLPQPADFDGDGRAELIVYRPSNGIWYIFNLANNDFSAFQFGAPEDKPVIGDYDGDGRADIAVFRPSNGIWYIRSTMNGQITGTQFGAPTDRPVPGDYDGDGRTDIAVFRPSNGIWYVQNSMTGFTAMQFGLSTDEPTPGDYDGDGRTDIAVYRPSNGIWYLQRSRDGLTGIQFGIAEDRPVPNAFVPQ